MKHLFRPHRPSSPLAALLLLFALAATAAEPQFISLSDEFSPPVDAALTEAADGAVTITVRPGQTPYRVTGRLAARRERDKVYNLSRFPATVSLTEAELGKGPLRLGLELSWFNADGSLRQREVFFSPRVGNRLPQPERLAVFDLARHRRELADAAGKITIPVTMSQPGKATIVIEDAAGNRIRNLLSGSPLSAGNHRIEWDGRTESGVMATPGKFTARIVTHPGLEYRYRMQFENGDESFFTPWGPNHGVIRSFTDNGKHVFAAAPLTEGGNAIVALTPEGKFVRAYQQIHGTGIHDVYLAANDSHLYAIHGGRTWLSSKKQVITLTGYRIADSAIVPFSGKQFALLYESDDQTPALTGAALFRGKLYIAKRNPGEILEIDPATAKILRRIPCSAPGLLAVSGDKLYLAADSGVSEFDPAKQAFRRLFAINYAPRGFSAVNGRFWLTGAPDSTAKCYRADGSLTDTLGMPGGDYTGKWQPQRLVAPTGIHAAADSSLWVAEARRNPKRITRWQYPAKKLLYAKYGSPEYGSPSAGVDPDHPERWIADSTEWKVDERAGTAEPVHVLLENGGHLGKLEKMRNYRFFRRDGRTFVTGSRNGMTIISEYLPEGRLRDLALIASVHHLYRAADQETKNFLKPVFDRAYPGFATNAKRSSNRSLILWTDRNGNARMDADEIQCSPENSSCSVGYWGAQISGSDFQLLYRSAPPERRFVIATLRPAGYHPGGAPQYDLAAALAAAVPLQGELPPEVTDVTGAESFHLPDGSIVTNTTPLMFSFAKDGRIQWMMKNRWTNVHGSQKAPLPRTGEMQGVLFSLGNATLPDGTEIMALMGNHGRVFFITGDGIYLDELFSDCRLAGLNGPGMIGGEPFGGFFGRDNRNQRYLLQGGNSGYRIYEIANLDKLTRARHKMNLTQQQLETAVRRNPPADADAQKAVMTIPWKTTASLSGLRSATPVAVWPVGARNVELRAVCTDRELLLLYSMPDASPWVNNGKSWPTLFKTGDCVDWQIALNPAAKPDRNRAEPGDLRLLVAPFDGGNAAILYRHKANPGEVGLNPMEFTSPWRSAKVDDVRRTDRIRINVERFDGSSRIGIQIPLTELGVTAAQLRGKSFRGDFGVIFGDHAGTVNLSRVYWANKETGLVNDVPGEMLPEPAKWGEIKFGE